MEGDSGVLDRMIEKDGDGWEVSCIISGLSSLVGTFVREISQHLYCTDL